MQAMASDPSDIGCRLMLATCKFISGDLIKCL